MRKTFMGVKLKTLREQRGLTQAALAAQLRLSPSYVNQLENNQRPLSVPVLLRLQAVLGVDLQLFSEDDEARLQAALRDVLAEAAPRGVPGAELQALAQQLPAVADALLRLHRRCRAAEDRLESVAAELGDDRSPALPSSLQMPHEEVRDFFYARHNHIAVLDERAERLHEHLSGAQEVDAAALSALIVRHLDAAHDVRVVRSTRGPADNALRRFDPSTRLLWLAAHLEPGRAAFQLAMQLAFLEAGDAIDALADEERFASAEARALARIGLAAYFAGALVLPYRRFLAAAEQAHYDIESLADRYGVSFETVCHRLSTLQRPDAPGVPFFFIRVDRAGNISKRQSATDFHFSRTGGTCPRWNVYEAFSQPGRVITQRAVMPDGRTYLWIARSVTHAGGAYGAPERSFAVALGCDIRHAGRLVYAKGLDLGDPDAATPIGAGCRICDRQDCTQRAFPALGKALRVDENRRGREPYASSGE